VAGDQLHRAVPLRHVRPDIRQLPAIGLVVETSCRFLRQALATLGWHSCRTVPGDTGFEVLLPLTSRTTEES